MSHFSFHDEWWEIEGTQLWLVSFSRIWHLVTNRFWKVSRWKRRYLRSRFYVNQWILGSVRWITIVSEKRGVSYLWCPMKPPLLFLHPDDTSLTACTFHSHNTATATWVTLIFSPPQTSVDFSAARVLSCSTLIGRWRFFCLVNTKMCPKQASGLTSHWFRSLSLKALSLLAHPSSPGQVLGGLWVSHKTHAPSERKDNHGPKSCALSAAIHWYGTSHHWCKVWELHMSTWVLSQ